MKLEKFVVKEERNLFGPKYDKVSFEEFRSLQRSIDFSSIHNAEALESYSILCPKIKIRIEQKMASQLL